MLIFRMILMKSFVHRCRKKKAIRNFRNELFFELFVLFCFVLIEDDLELLIERDEQKEKMRENGQHLFH